MSTTPEIDWTKPIEHVDGRPARLVATLKRPCWPRIVVFGDDESFESLTDCGRIGGLDFPPIIRNVPQRFSYVRYVNIYTDGHGGSCYSRKEADRNAHKEGRIACIRVVVEGVAGQFDE